MSGRDPQDAALSLVLAPYMLLHYAVCVVMLTAVGVLAYFVTAANLQPRYATAAAIGVPATIMVWALWSPASSNFRMWIVETIVVLTRVTMMFAIFFALLRLWGVGFAIGPWLASAWDNLLVIPVALLVEKGVAFRIARSSRAMARREVRAR